MRSEEDKVILEDFAVSLAEEGDTRKTLIVGMINDQDALGRNTVGRRETRHAQLNIKGLST